MKTLSFFLFALLTQLAPAQEAALTGVPRRNIVPMEVKERAQAAVQKVVDETVRGNFKAALDSMNPDFLKILSRRHGGPAKYKEGMLKMMNEMGKNGLTFQAAITQNADIAFEVDFGTTETVVDGVSTKVQSYRSWMVFVPTVSDIQVLDTTVQPAKLRKFRQWDFQVAISPKEEEKWTFVGGSSINALDLRKVFPFLPQDDKKLQFPEVKRKELK